MGLQRRAHHDAAIIRQSRHTGERELVQMRWGLVPFFTKSLGDVKGISTINARAETVAGSGTFREPFKRRRCIVLASGFYEWKKLDAKNKQPFAFDLANGKMMGFAGLWDAWKEPKASPQAVDHWLQSFPIIATEANELMAPVHNRMPVILHSRDFDRWLDREGHRPAADRPAAPVPRRRDGGLRSLQRRWQR